MRRLIVTLIISCVVASVAVAQVSDTTWQVLLNRYVIVTNSDGTQVTGELAMVTNSTVSLILKDGEVVTIPRQGVQEVRAVMASSAPAAAPPSAASTASTGNATNMQIVNPPKKPTRASCSDSRQMGISDADTYYKSAWGFGGFFLGLIGVAISYGTNPSPVAIPDESKVNVGCYTEGYREEAKRKDESAAWGGWGLGALLESIVLLAVSVSSS